MPDPTTSEGVNTAEQAHPVGDQADQQHRHEGRDAGPDRLAEQRRQAEVGQPSLHPVDQGGGGRTERHHRERPADQGRHGRAEQRQRHRDHPPPVGVRGAGHRVQPLARLPHRDATVDDLADQPLDVLEPGEVGRAHLHRAQHRHRVGATTAVPGHRDRGVGDVDVHRLQVVGVGQPQDRRDDVRGRGAGRQQQLTDPQREVHHGAGVGPVDPLAATGDAERPHRRGRRPHRLGGALTQRTRPDGLRPLRPGRREGA